MKFSLPFWLENEAWEKLQPPAISKLAQREDLDPYQEELLAIFRTLDMRVEWLCRRMVFVNNVAIVLSIVMIAAGLLVMRNPEALKIILELLQ